MSGDGSNVRALAPQWPDRYAHGAPKSTYLNTLLAMERLGARFSRDLFRQRDTIVWHQLPEGLHEISDSILILLRDAVAAQFDFDPKAQNVADAARSLCVQYQFDPVCDHFRALKWDGVERLERWLVTYLGAEDTPLHRAFGRIVLTAAVRRAYRPGTKFDCILVLEGPQGVGKSSALRMLAPHEDFFTDQDMLHLDTQAQQEALAGKLIVELGELAGLRRTDAERIKAFASRTHDRARAAYAHTACALPRRCVFIGTTNNNEYLTDPTGNRRFWPVRVGEVDLVALAADVDQLWAEAAVGAEDETESIVLPAALWGEATQAQDERLEHDPWQDKISNLAGEYHYEGARKISTHDIMTALEIPMKDRHAGTARRIAIAMRKLGWSGPIDIRSGSSVVKGYTKIVGETNA